MTKDEILARELGKLGAKGGAVGGLAGGILTGAAGAAGGFLGARLAANFLPSEIFETKFSLVGDPEQALVQITNVLSSMGQLLDKTDLQSPGPSVSALLGSGFLNMNPCTVSIELVSFAGGVTTARLITAAKEGLIKQGTAKKAATRVLSALTQQG